MIRLYEHVMLAYQPDKADENKDTVKDLKYSRFKVYKKFSIDAKWIALHFSHLLTVSYVCIGTRAVGMILYVGGDQLINIHLVVNVGGINT